MRFNHPAEFVVEERLASISAPHPEPLRGVRVLVLRTLGQSQGLADALRNLGAVPILVPAIEVQPVTDQTAVDLSVHRLDSYDCIAFTSVNGVTFFFERALQLNIDPRKSTKASWAAVGQATAQVLQTFGIKVDLRPSETSGVGLSRALETRLLPGSRILLPRAELADNELPTALRAAGYRVQTLVVYRTVPPRELALALDEVFANGVDAAIFTSPSTVAYTLDALDGDVSRFDGITGISIGPVTTRAAEARGLVLDAEAKERSAQGIAQALASRWSIE